jgi:uncharacterized protein
MTLPSSQSESWVFVDTGAYFALTFAGDEHHDHAVAIARQIAQEHRQLVTTNFVLAETHALILNKLNRDIALQVLEGIDQSNTRIVRVSQSDETLARDILRKYQDKEYSLTDATSFVVMERLGITSAFAFDHHFMQYGFIVLHPR